MVELTKKQWRAVVLSNFALKQGRCLKRFQTLHSARAEYPGGMTAEELVAAAEKELDAELQPTVASQVVARLGLNYVEGRGDLPGKIGGGSVKKFYLPEDLELILAGIRAIHERRQSFAARMVPTD